MKLLVEKQRIYDMMNRMAVLYRKPAVGKRVCMGKGFYGE